MLDKYFLREDVKSLIKFISTSTKYNTNISGSPLKLGFLDIKDSLLFVYESLYKYNIIVEDEDYLDDFIIKLNRYLFRLNDYNSMTKGVNRLIGKYLYEKLGLLEDRENKKIVLNYIYYKYINNGYLFYGCNDITFNYIINNGFDSSKISSFTNVELTNIFKELDINIVKEVGFTDNFINACYDGYSYPNHLNRIVNNQFTAEGKYDLDVFYRKDLLGSLSCLNKLCKSLELNKKKRENISNLFVGEWNKYSIDKSLSKVILIKRSVLGLDSISNIETIIEESLDKEIEVGIFRIIDYKYNNILVNGVISTEEITSINLGSNKDIYLDEVSVENEVVFSNKLSNQFGVTTWLYVLVSILVNLGILFMIIFLGGYL